MAAYTPAQMSKRLLALVNALTAALSRGMKKAATAVNRAAIKNLSGSRKAAPWTYPVPVRTPGGLRANQGMQIESPTVAYIFNTAAYAAAIHSGYVSSWAGRGKHRMVFHKPRLFIDDAVESEQPLMVIQREVEGAIAAWA
jgi:hypothetical protein